MRPQNLRTSIGILALTFLWYDAASGVNLVVN